MSDVPPSLAALYASERAADGAPQADRERIRNAVLASVGVTVVAGGTTTAAAAATGLGIAGKLVVVLVTLGVIGGGAALLSRDETTEVARPTIHEEPRVSAPERVTVAPTIVAEPAPPIAPPAPPRSSTPPAPRVRVSHPAPIPNTPAPSIEAAPVESDVQRLTRAVSLSARGDDAGALALLDSVATSSGVAEERDALRAITLSKLGRIDEACASVTAFVARYPHSIHRAAVEEVPCSEAH